MLHCLNLRIDILKGRLRSLFLFLTLFIIVVLYWVCIFA